MAEAESRVKLLNAEEITKYLTILGLPASHKADTKLITAAYKSKMKSAHPDKSQAVDLAKAQEITEANRLLQEHISRYGSINFIGGTYDVITPAAKAADLDPAVAAMRSLYRRPPDSSGDHAASRSDRVETQEMTEEDKARMAAFYGAKPASAARSASSANVAPKGTALPDKP